MVKQKPSVIVYNLLTPLALIIGSLQPLRCCGLRWSNEPSLQTSLCPLAPVCSTAGRSPADLSWGGPANLANASNKIL